MDFIISKWDFSLSMGCRLSWNSSFVIIKLYFIKCLTVMNLKWVVSFAFRCYLYSQLSSFEKRPGLAISSLMLSWIFWLTLIEWIHTIFLYLPGILSQTCVCENRSVQLPHIDTVIFCRALTTVYII